MSKQVIRVGHRGAGALCPHNTRLSFETALAAGVDMVETDLRRCATGEIVLAHDDSIHAADGASLPVTTSTLEDLRRVDIGEGQRILLLEDLLALAQGRCGVMLDLKGEGFEDEIVQVLRESGFDPAAVIIPGGSLRSRQRLRESAPEYRLSLSLGGAPAGGITPAFLDSIDTPAVTWYHRILTLDVIEALHLRHEFVYAWTVDYEDLMQRLIRDGADGIITNRPDVLTGVLHGHE